MDGRNDDERGHYRGEGQEEGRTILEWRDDAGGGYYMREA